MVMTPREPDDPRNSPVILRREMIEGGMNDAAIARLVRAGILAKVRFGAYVDGPRWRSLDQAGRYGIFTRAAIRQAKTGVIASHVSALPEYDVPLWGLDLSHVHLTRRDGRTGRKAAGVHQHCGVVLDDDVVTVNGIEIMSATRTALEVTCVADTESSLAVVNALLHEGLTTIDALRARYAPMVEWPGSLHTELVLRLADRRIENLAESRTLHLCWRHHIPRPHPQYEISDALGEILARLDFAWPESGVWLEFDGKEKYVKHRRPGESVVDAVLREKAREQMISELTGWRCIRITWADLENPRATAERILRMLGLQSLLAG